MRASVQERADRLLELADDELILGWRNSEWTGVAPFLEEDVAFSSIARHWLYETADELRVRALIEENDAKLAGLAAKIDREETYHRMHAQMWHDRLKDDPRFVAALEELEPLVEQRGEHLPEFAELWEEMTMVRRSVVGDQMAAKVRELGAEPEIQVVADDSWSTDRITPEGREKLREAGFAPPAPRQAAAPTIVQLTGTYFRCPYCGSTETRLENLFGPTPCRSLRYCA